MKKTYINPEMEIIKIASHQQMLAGSTVPIGDESTNPANSDAHFDEYEW